MAASTERVEPKASNTIDRAMRDGIAQSVFPGAVLLVRYRGEIVHRRAYGQAAVEPEPVPLTEDTIFDLASLTKPIVTATLTLMEVVAGTLALDAPVQRWIPDFHPRAPVTIAQLLSHSSGLPDWKPYYREIIRISREQSAMAGVLEPRQLLLEFIHQEPFVYTPGAGNIYSDLGYILLGELLERVGGKDLAQLAEAKIWGPLGMEDTFFVRLPRRPGPLRGTRTIAATERCAWRARVLCGEVQDDNAYSMGGIAGHAGVFSTADDLDRFLSDFSRAVRGGLGLLPSDLAARAVRPVGAPDSGWGLGWMLPTEPSSSGSRFSKNSFGHLGFTGTSIWVDPESDLSVILLTNRVHPDRKNEKIKEFRPMIHDLIHEVFVGP